MSKTVWGTVSAVLLACFCAQGVAEALPEKTEIVLTFGGDCVLATREEWKEEPNTFDAAIVEKGHGWPFELISEPFLTDDLSHVNLECVLQETGKDVLKDKQYRFRGDPSYTGILTAAGIEQVNLANNHFIDYGSTGRKSTEQALDKGGILYSGYEHITVFEKDGYKIGFGGCRETVYRQKKSVVKDDIAKLKKLGCDVIVYSLHWGEEYSPKHNKLQKRMAEYAVACGANLIIGTHPHCVQGLESIKGVPVIYSLGNLVFGGTHEMKTFDALMIRATLCFGPEGFEGVRLNLLPVLTSSAIPENDFRPMFAQGEDHRRIMNLIQKDSRMKIREELWFPVKQKKK